MNRTQSFLDAAEQLAVSSYAYVPFGVDEQALSEIYRGLDLLVSESKEFRAQCRWNILEGSEPDEGLLLREGTADHGDFKAFWHHFAFLCQYYPERLRTRYAKWTDLLDQYYAQCAVTSREFAMALDVVTQSKFKFTKGVLSYAGEMNTKFRILKYFRQLPEKDLALAHFDKSLFTLATHSTHHNLYLGDEGSQFKPAPPAGHIVVFSGNKMAMRTGGRYVGNKCFEGAEISAMRHVVKNTGRESENAAVFFCHDDTILPYE